VDHKLDMDFGGLMQAVEKHGQKALFDQAFALGKQSVGETQRLVDTLTLGAALHSMNDPRHIDTDPGAYMLLAQVGTPDDLKGPDVVAGWYQRNLLIYSNLVRLIESPEERGGQLPAPERQSPNTRTAHS
jgi:hypothetical protein